MIKKKKDAEEVTLSKLHIVELSEVILQCWKHRKDKMLKADGNL